MSRSPIVEQYLKNLIAVQQYRVNAARLGAQLPMSSNYFVGAGTPNAMQLAMEAMRAHSPIGVISSTPAKSTTESHHRNWYDFTGKAKDAVGAIFSAGPVKWGIEQLSRPMYMQGSILNTEKQQINEWKRTGKIPNLWEAYKDVVGESWEGLSLKQKIDPATALNIPKASPNDPWYKKAGLIGAGLAADIAYDPTSYIGPGLLKGGAKGVGAVAKGTQEAKIVKAADIIANLPKQAPLAIEGHSVAIPRFTAGVTGIEDRFNPATFANELQAQNLTKAVGETPVLTHPNLDVAPLYKDITETMTERVPKIIQEEVNIPIEPTSVVKSSEVKPVSPQLGQLRAVKLAVLQTPEYKISGHPIGELLRVAREHPESQRDIEQIINTHVKKIHKEKNFEGLPKIIPFTGRGGEGAPAFGLTLSQAAKLFTEGKIPKGVTGEATHAFPFHDPEDFKIATIKNSKGETVPLSKYLGDLGISIETVTSKGETSILSGPSSTSVFEFAKKPLTKTVLRPKTVYEEVQKTSTKTVRLSQAESFAWALQHQGKLSKDEINYLRAARTKESFQARVKELSLKTVAGNLKTLDDLVTARKAGAIPDESWQKILDIVGAKSDTDLIAKAKRIFKVTVESKLPKSSATEVPEILPGEIQRIKGRAPSTVFDGVKPVDEIIQDAAKGDTSLIDKPRPFVSQQIVNDLSHAMPESIFKNLARVLDPKGEFKWETTIKHAKRTSPVAGQGLGRNLHGWNKYSQSDAFRAIVSDASKRLYGMTHGVKGKEFYRQLRLRPKFMYQQVMPAMRAAEWALKQEGVKLVAGTDNSGLLLSMVDVLEHVEPKLVQKYLFSFSDKTAPNVYPTKFLDAAEGFAQAAIHGGSMDLARENARGIFKTLSGSERMGKSGSAEELTKGIESALPGILQRVNANYAEQSIKIGESVKSMTDEVINKIVTKYTDPNVSAGDVFKDIIDRYSEMASIGSKVKAPAEALPMAKVITDSELASKGVTAGDLAEASIAGRIKNSANAKEAAKVGRSQQSSRASEGLSSAEPNLDLGELADIRLQQGVYRANTPVLDKLVAIKDSLGHTFVASYASKDMHVMVHQYGNVVQTFSSMHHKFMEATFDIANKSYPGQTSEKLAEAFKILQTGAEVIDPAMIPLIDAMSKSIGVLFGGGHAAFASRNGLFSEHLNDILDKFGVRGDIRFASNVPLVKQAESWKTWADVTDPLDTLDKIHAAYQRSTVAATVGRDFSSQWGKASQVAGHVKITDTKNVSLIHKFIDTDLYYPKDLVKQIPYVDRFLEESLYSPHSDLIRLYDQVLHAFKAGVTIYRPGHHVRNLIGDMGLSFLAGVQNPRRYYEAMRILKGRSSTYGKDWDAFLALQSNDVAKTVDAGKDVSIKMANGKIVKLSDDQVWRAGFNQGLLQHYLVREDIAFNEAQKFGGRLGAKWGVTRPLAGQGQKVAGNVSMARDHAVRLAHFIDALKKVRASTLEEAFAEAGKQVRKWHPDGSDLTKFEKQTMRRVIPFYSWFRKAIPLVVESMVMTPGRALVVPKAMMNFSRVMGINPDSLGNPFPANSLFPSWLQDNILGPQWTGSLGPFGEDNGQMYGFNPGDPVSDLGSSYLGANAPRQILGSLTPLAKIPIELGMKENLAIGTPIQSTSEYMDQQVPGLGYVNSIFGKDFFGGMQDNMAVESGTKQSGVDSVALMNFLTGLGVKTYNKPSYVRSANYELQQEARDRARHG